MKLTVIFLSIFLFACNTKNHKTKEIIYKPNLNLEASNFIFKNGLWFNGDFKNPKFSTKEVYSSKGIFVSETPDNATTLDLEGQFIIPPFGEAHNHSVDSEWTKKQAQKYISQGVFYYKNPNNLSGVANSARPYWSRANTLDVSFSHGGISVSGGHPDMLYQKMQRNYGMTFNKIDGEAFFSAPSIAQLKQKWPSILAAKPDFIKLYLLNYNSEDSKGLSKSVFQEAVKLSKDAGLRITVHIESLEDLQLSVDSRVDEAAHLVSRKIKTAIQNDGVISEKLLDQIVENGFITVTTTLITKEQYYKRPETLSKIQKVQAINLKNLKSKGALIAIGTDSFISTAIDEAENLRDLKVFSDSEILKILVETPTISIFPHRAIGKFENNYETSFLGLNCNPFERFECIKDIKTKIKQGAILKTQ